jgi:hypothetical protein
MLPPPLLLAVDLTGVWSGKREMPGGRTMESTFAFESDGQKITTQRSESTPLRRWTAR